MTQPVNQPNPSPNALPIYVQIAELLIREIGAGRLIDGERLPPERDMAARLQISVGTLRKALRELTDKGLLERVQGSGNYVRSGPSEGAVYAMFRLELPEGGGLPRADILSVDRLIKPSDLPFFGAAEHAARIRRLRYLNDTIIAVEEIWLDESVGMVEASALSDSLYQYYQSQLGFWITRAEDRVSIGSVPDWAPDSFTCPSGAIVGFIERYSWADAAHPVEYSRTWFDPDRAIYVQRLK
ncbi:MAG: GntR family transcriptional regulator [Pseudomonadota bacterium]